MERIFTSSHCGLADYIQSTVGHLRNKLPVNLSTDDSSSAPLCDNFMNHHIISITLWQFLSAYNWENVKLLSICKGRQHFVAEDRTLRVHHIEERLEDLEVERRRQHFPPETKTRNSRIILEKTRNSRIDQYLAFLFVAATTHLVCHLAPVLVRRPVKINLVH